MIQHRQNVNLELQEGCREQLDTVRGWNGMTQKELISRLIEWFCRQDRVVQQLILGQIPSEIAPDVAVMILRNLAQLTVQGKSDQDQSQKTLHPSAI